MIANNELLDLVNDLLTPIDELVSNINKIIPNDEEKVDINAFRADLSGMLAIAICATYENCIKEILRYQASLYHPKFQHYISDTYNKLNSKIAFDDLKKYAKMFDSQLVERFQEKIKEKVGNDKKELPPGRIVNDIWMYQTLLDIRHNFAHSYKKIETLEVVYKYHQLSKNVILSFAEALSQTI